MAKFYAKAPNGDDAVLSISIQNFTQSLQQNGWCKLPNGLIIQWYNPTYSTEGSFYTPIVWPLSVQNFINCWGCIANASPTSTTSGNAFLVPIFFWVNNGVNGLCSLAVKLSQFSNRGGQTTTYSSATLGNLANFWGTVIGLFYQ